MSLVLTDLEQEADEFRLAMDAFAANLSPDEVEGFVDQTEKRMLELFPRRELELQHRFTQGLYARTIHMPAGSLLTSEIHVTEHQFVILVGNISVWTHHEGAQLLRAPYHGKTIPGMRRILYAHTDTVWTTFHATTETDPDEIKKSLIQDHTNPLLEKAQLCPSPP